MSKTISILQQKEPSKQVGLKILRVASLLWDQGLVTGAGPGWGGEPGLDEADGVKLQYQLSFTQAVLLSVTLLVMMGMTKCLRDEMK